MPGTLFSGTGGTYCSGIAGTLYSGRGGTLCSGVLNQPSAQEYVLRGMAYDKEQKYAEALKWYRLAAEQGNANANAQNNMSIAIIVATFFGPIIAVQSQKILEQFEDTRKRRKDIFRQLMLTRANSVLVSDVHVSALNICLLYTSPSPRD